MRVTHTDIVDPLGALGEVFTSIIVTHCIVNPGSSKVNRGTDRTVVDDGITIFMPAGTVVKSSDSLIVRGEKWKIDSLPAAWVRPAGFRIPIKVMVSCIRAED